MSAWADLVPEMPAARKRPPDALLPQSTETVDTLLRRVGMWHRLRPEQRDCVKEACARTLLPPHGASENAFILEKQPGWGKTRLTLAMAVAICGSRYDEPMRVLVLAPNNLASVWSSEMKKVMPHLRFEEFWGEQPARKGVTSEARRTAWLRRRAKCASANVCWTSHGIFCNEADKADRGASALLAGDLRATWNVVIVDEAHKARDPESLLFRRLSELRSGGPLAPNGVVLLATATMFMNRAADVHSLLSLATNNPHLPPGMGVLAVYRPRFMCASTASGIEEVDEELLPLEKHEVNVDMSKEEKALYEASSLKYMAQWEAGRLAAGKSAEGAVGMRGATLGVRQILEAPGNIDSKIDSTKGAALRDILNVSADKNKQFVVYCVFRRTPDAIQKAASAAGRTVYVLNGNVSKVGRARVLEEWKKDPRGVLAAQLHVAGLGHNWQFATRVVFMIRWFNEAMENQAIARVWRRGQTQTVKVFYLRYNVFADSGWIDGIHARKRAAKKNMYIQHEEGGEESEVVQEIDLARLYDHMAVGNEEGGSCGMGL